MKIPESIRIAGVEYKVEYVEHLSGSGKLLYGQIDFEKVRIRLSDTVTTEHQHKCMTLWHEILHGLQEHYGISLPADKEEDIIDKFSMGIYQVLQDNGRRLFDLIDPEVSQRTSCIAPTRCPFYSPFGCGLDPTERTCNKEGNTDGHQD